MLPTKKRLGAGKDITITGIGVVPTAPGCIKVCFKSTAMILNLESESEKVSLSCI